MLQNNKTPSSTVAQDAKESSAAVKRIRPRQVQQRIRIRPRQVQQLIRES